MRTAENNRLVALGVFDYGVPAGTPAKDADHPMEWMLHLPGALADIVADVKVVLLIVSCWTGYLYMMERARANILEAAVIRLEGSTAATLAHIQRDATEKDRIHSRLDDIDRKLDRIPTAQPDRCSVPGEPR